MERIDSDLVVVGTGVAGLAAAIGAEGLAVDLLSKGELRSGSSPWAQGGVAAAIGIGDSAALHAADTIAAGGGLVEPAIARLLARDGVAAIRALIERGAEFDRDAQGELALGREAAHSRSRILHARGDATGAELVRALIVCVRRSSNIATHENACAVRIVIDEGRIAGVVAQHRDGRAVHHRAPRVVLATGGLGQLFLRTTNPAAATGDGLVLAAEAGALLVDVEFVQFHPTALAVEADPAPLLSEALRGEGAILIGGRGERFMRGEHEAAELAPRDVVARAIWRRLGRGEQVFLDAREALGERLPERFPSVFAACREHGIDPRVEPVPVVPAAHYFMGGVGVDEQGRSSVPGLWACGEIASTGAHGANRLASNSLLEALVFGARAARSAAAFLPKPIGAVATGARPAPPIEPNLREAVRRLAWERIGLVRDETGLLEAEERLAGWWPGVASVGGEGRSLVGAAMLVAAAARRRRESRGAHFRADHPATVAEWGYRQRLRAEIGERAIAIRFEPAPVAEAS